MIKKELEETISEAEAVLRNEYAPYSIKLSDPLMSFISANVGVRADKARGIKVSQNFGQSMNDNLYDKLLMSGQLGRDYSGCYVISLNYVEIDHIGKFLLEATGEEPWKSGFTRNASRSFLELNGAFVEAGGKDNDMLRELFEARKEGAVG